MKTIKTFVDELRILLHASSEEIDDRTLISWINGQRAVWLKNEINKGKPIDPSITQVIPCLELEVVDASVCGLLKTKHRILRTISEIPKTIVNKYNDGILSIRRPIMLDQPFNYTTREAAVYAGNGKFNKGDIFIFPYEQRMYIKLSEYNRNINFITHITIEGVFEDPLEVAEYQDCNNSPCFDPENEEYPITESIWQYMINAIHDNRFRLLREDKLDPIPSE